MEKNALCDQFAYYLGGRGKEKNGVCSVSFHRDINLTIEGKKSTNVLVIDVSYESLDNQGQALNLLEIAILQKEIPNFVFAAVQQGIIVSAIHNHWLFTSPVIMYVHLQSIEPPLQFARKIAYAFTQLSIPPIPD